MKGVLSNVICNLSPKLLFTLVSIKDFDYWYLLHKSKFTDKRLTYVTSQGTVFQMPQVFHTSVCLLLDGHRNKIVGNFVLTCNKISNIFQWISLFFVNIVIIDLMLCYAQA